MQQPPPSRYTRYEDVICGLAIFALGVFGLVVSRSYPVGTLSSMGPGWFPRAICFIIIGLGLLLIAINLRTRPAIAEGMSRLRLRPLLLVVVSFLAFALTLNSLGLLPAILFMILISALAVPRHSIWELIAIILALEGMALAMWSLVRLSVPLIGAK